MLCDILKIVASNMFEKYDVKEPSWVGSGRFTSKMDLMDKNKTFFIL